MTVPTLVPTATAPATPTAATVPTPTATATTTGGQANASDAFFGGNQPGSSSEPDLYADKAPEFPTDLEWLNTDRPLSLAQLTGKIVLLDFWTYGCINCVHNFPELKRLEANYPDELVVIGIHSAKFTNESQTDNIRQMILRYDLDYPVINDKDLNLWYDWNARAWPTLVLIDPVGNIAGLHLGEGVYHNFNPLIRQVRDAFAARDKLDTTPLHLKLEREGLPESVLSFPGKVLAAPSGERLFIADTNHNRIVMADPDSGQVLGIIGGGAPGLSDGDFQNALFMQPQGMALSPDEQTLYVADAGNHTVRRVDLANQIVETIAGTGEKIVGPPSKGGLALETALSSPWDLALDGDTLYIAMAGVHQIWTLDLAAEMVTPLVGNGLEGYANGAFDAAQLAQPNALALGENGALYFADTEASTMRVAHLAPDPNAGTVETLTGLGISLFDFGDVDGVGRDVRLQHPQGLTLVDGSLYIADTYNNKIKRLDPATREVTTILGSAHGWSDGADPLFYELGGIDAAGGKLYVADTNNHAIRIVDLATLETRTLVLKDIQQFTAQRDDKPFGDRQIVLEPVQVTAGPGTVALDVKLPAGYKINDLAPYSMEWHVQNTGAGDLVVLEPDANRSIAGPEFPLTLDATFQPGQGTLTADLTIIYCEAETESLCLIDQTRLEQPLVVAAANTDVAESEVTLTYQVELNQ
ncbi:MAG: thioredoxin-like domain-containing protein [Caldilineaceae bacterium]